MRRRDPGDHDFIHFVSSCLVLWVPLSDPFCLVVCFDLVLLSRIPSSRTPYPVSEWAWYLSTESLYLLLFPPGYLNIRRTGSPGQRENGEHTNHQAHLAH
ncbi:hypothetical protein C8R45DRAFT_967911 [Mycena sanguinolenta]|nr:hypothetical protein C8R45DRAFT_967911 [Mycena sanguinolenta]